MLRIGKIVKSLVPKYLKERIKSQRLIKTIPTWDRNNGLIMPDKAIKIGIVGAGQYAKNHIEVLNSLHNVSIEAICATTETRAKILALQFKIPKIYTNLDDFCKDDSFDCVFVIVPIPLTKVVVCKCLKTGRPVFLEKPAGLNSVDTREMLEVSLKTNNFGIVGMNRRFYSGIEHGLAALANSGPVRGGILEIHENISSIVAQGRFDIRIIQNWMIAQTIHALDLYKYIYGKPLEIQKLISNRGGLNRSLSLSASLIHPGNVHTNILGLWDTKLPWSLKVITENAWLVASPLEKASIYRPGGIKIPIPVDEVDLKFRMGLYSQDVSFLNFVKDSSYKSPALSDLPDALETVLFIEDLFS